MQDYIIRRIVYSFLLIFLAVSAIFFLVNWLPGSPFDRMRREMADRDPQLVARIPPSHWERLDELLGLHRPVHERYLTWIRDVFSGDLGISWSVRLGEDVSAVILSRLPHSLLLMFTSILLSLAIAVPIGLYSALRPYTNGDFILTLSSFFGMAMPTFWIGTMLMSIFAVTLDWLPYNGVMGRELIDKGDIIALMGRVLTLGFTQRQMAGYEWKVFVDGIQHLILPTITLAVVSTARWSRFVRSSMLETLRQDYVRTARAKGAPEWIVILKHCLPNSLVPVITVLALDIPMLFTGSFLTEVVFSWPGIGRLYIDSFRQNDWPLLMGILVIYTFLIVFANFFADLLYSIVDPRIRYS